MGMDKKSFTLNYHMYWDLVIGWIVTITTIIQGL